jgi:hypothetical protein
MWSATSPKTKNSLSLDGGFFIGGYYAWLRGGACERAKEGEALMVQTEAIHRHSRETYGDPRIHAELKAPRDACG